MLSLISYDVTTATICDNGRPYTFAQKTLSFKNGQPLLKQKLLGLSYSPRMNETKL